MSKLIICDGDNNLIIEKEKCIKLELEFNQSEYGKVWRHIGDRLYYFACPRNLSDQDTLFLVNTQQLSFLRNIFSSIYGENE